MASMALNSGIKVDGGCLYQCPTIPTSSFGATKTSVNFPAMRITAGPLSSNFNSRRVHCHSSAASSSSYSLTEAAGTAVAALASTVEVGFSVVIESIINFLRLPIGPYRLIAVSVAIPDRDGVIFDKLKKILKESMEEMGENSESYSFLLNECSQIMLEHSDQWILSHSHVARGVLQAFYKVGLPCRSRHKKTKSSFMDKNGYLRCVEFVLMLSTTVKGESTIYTRERSIQTREDLKVFLQELNAINMEVSSGFCSTIWVEEKPNMVQEYHHISI